MCCHMNWVENKHRCTLNVHQSFQLHAPKQTPLNNGVECLEPRPKVGMLELPMIYRRETCWVKILCLIIGFGDPSMHLLSCQPVHQKIMISNQVQASQQIWTSTGWRLLYTSLSNFLSKFWRKGVLVWIRKQ